MGNICMVQCYALILTAETHRQATYHNSLNIHDQNIRNKDMNDIVAIFNNFLTQYGSVDIAEAEFKKMLHEDDELHTLYRDWCHEVGSTEKTGFADYAEEYLDRQDDVWEALNDYDDDRF